MNKGIVAISAVLYSLAPSVQSVPLQDQAMPRVGTSGATICLLNKSCTWSARQSFGGNWLEPTIPSSSSLAYVPVLSPDGNLGLLGASRTSDLATARHMSTIGVGGFVLNDNATRPSTAYAFYGEARRYAGSGTTHVIEADIINEGSTVSLNPYDTLSRPGLTVAHWLSSGRSDVANRATASAAFVMISNGSAFQRGIVFTKDAISGATGSAGTGEAVTMAQGQQLVWYAPDGRPAAYVWSAIASGEQPQRLVFTDKGPQFQNAVGNGLFSVGASATAANGLTLTPGEPGVTPVLAATGKDSTIALAIRSKGDREPIYLQNGNGDTALQVDPVASGTNYIVVEGGAKGESAQLKAAGKDKNIDLKVTPQGAGRVLAGGAGIQYPSFLYGSLPELGSAGTMVFCADCRKPGEAATAGTGTMVFDDGHRHWVSTAGTIAVN